MIFIDLFQWLGYHVPALGAFVCSLLVVAVICFVSYKLGQRAANKKWQWDVEHQPSLLSQDIRERWERRIAVLEERNKILQAQADQILPAFKALTDLAAYFVEQDKAAR